MAQNGSRLELRILCGIGVCSEVSVSCSLESRIRQKILRSTMQWKGKKFWKAEK